MLFCAPTRVSLNMINGRVVVRDGVLQTVDLRKLVARHNALSIELVNG